MANPIGNPVTAAKTMVRVQADEAARFVAAILSAKGLPSSDAQVMAGNLVRADLRGVETHGIVRLPGYLDRLARHLINPAPTLVPRRVTPVTAHLDGDNGFGFVVAHRAMEECITIADESGIGLVGVSRSTHFGMAASYLLQAVERGFMALVFTNASRAMPPWGGRDPFLGTSPFAAGVPGGDNGPFILDMAPSVAARGKIRKALRLGETIPEGYALDEQGRPTTDPAEALKGVVLPIGGPKGAGLSMLMDLLAGVFPGAAFGGDVGDQYKDYDRPQNVGHLFLTIKPGLFMTAEAFRARMDTAVERIHQCRRADGFQEILIPGEPESRHETERRRTGIPYYLEDLAPLVAEAEAMNVPALVTCDSP